MPAGAESDAEPLLALFASCVVRVDADGEFRGTGFLVAPGEMLTCAHVVHSGQTITVSTTDGRCYAAEAISPLLAPEDLAARFYPLPNAALLRLVAAPAAHPCVRLDLTEPVTTPRPDVFRLDAYTRGENAEDVVVRIGAALEYEVALTEDGWRLYKLRGGRVVVGGFSGGPLLNRRTGGVCAVVDSSRSEVGDLVSVGVPMAAVLGELPGLRERNEAFHAADPRWQRALENAAVHTPERDDRHEELPLTEATRELDWSTEPTQQQGAAMNADNNGLMSEKNFAARPLPLGLTLSEVVDLAGIWGFLWLVPSTLILIFSLPLAETLGWLLSIVVMCTLVTMITRRISLLLGGHGALLTPAAAVRVVRQARRSDHAYLAFMGTAFVLIPVATLTIISLVPSNALPVPQKPVSEPSGNGGHACGYEVGAEGGEYAQAFRQAYERHGGAPEVGCAVNPVTRIRDGLHQNFEGGHIGPNAAFATDPAEAFLVKGEFHTGYRIIGDGDGQKTIELAGYPLGEGVELDGGLRLDIGDTRHRRSAVIKRHRGEWYWVQAAFLSTYDEEFGGPEGRLGYPAGDAEIIGQTAGLRQHFERGVLCYVDGVARAC